MEQINSLIEVVEQIDLLVNELSFGNTNQAEEEKMSHNFYLKGTVDIKKLEFKQQMNLSKNLNTFEHKLVELEQVLKKEEHKGPVSELELEARIKELEEALERQKKGLVKVKEIVKEFKKLG